MTHMTLEARLEAARNALAALTLQMERARPDTPISTFDTELRIASRAIARLEVLAAMHPDLQVGSTLPRGSVEDTSSDDHRSLALLKEAARPDTVTVHLTASVERHEPSSILAEKLNNTYIVAEFIDGGYVADISSVVLAAGLDLFPDEEGI